MLPFAQANVQRLKSYRSSLAIFPRRVNKPKVRHSHTGTEVTRAGVDSGGGGGSVEGVLLWSCPCQPFGTRGMQRGPVLFAWRMGAPQQLSACSGVGQLVKGLPLACAWPPISYLI